MQLPKITLNVRCKKDGWTPPSAKFGALTLGALYTVRSIFLLLRPSEIFYAVKRLNIGDLITTLITERGWVRKAVGLLFFSVCGSKFARLYRVGQ